MKKRTIKKTFFELDNNKNEYPIFHIFGLSDNDIPLEINENNINHLREYVENYVEEYGNNFNLLNILDEVENELEKVDEVQFLI